MNTLSVHARYNQEASLSAESLDNAMNKKNWNEYAKRTLPRLCAPCNPQKWLLDHFTATTIRLIKVNPSPTVNPEDDNMCISDDESSSSVDPLATNTDSIPLDVFIQRMVVAVRAKSSAVLAACVLLDRMRAALPAGARGVASTHRRLAIAALRIGEKYFSDYLPVRSAVWARAATAACMTGKNPPSQSLTVPARDINLMERQMLELLGHAIHMHKSEFERVLTEAYVSASLANSYPTSQPAIDRSSKTKSWVPSDASASQIVVENEASNTNNRTSWPIAQNGVAPSVVHPILRSAAWTNSQPQTVSVHYTRQAAAATASQNESARPVEKEQGSSLTRSKTSAGRSSTSHRRPNRQASTSANTDKWWSWSRKSARNSVSFASPAALQSMHSASPAITTYTGLKDPKRISWNDSAPSQQDGDEAVVSSPKSSVRSPTNYRSPHPSKRPSRIALVQRRMSGALSQVIPEAWTRTRY